MPNHFGEIN